MNLILKQLVRPRFVGGIFAAFLLLFAGGCATPRKVIVRPGSAGAPAEIYDSKPTAVMTGKASYYYGRWIGRLTANGETYRASDVTAAHKTLPFNTMVRVTNLQNGKSVIVRINNRGPYVKGRILDLSLVAAQQISMTGAGVVPVRAEVLKKLPVIEKPTGKTKIPKFLTQVEKPTPQPSRR